MHPYPDERRAAAEREMFLVAMGAGYSKAVAFTLAMIAGMMQHGHIQDTDEEDREEYESANVVDS